VESNILLNQRACARRFSREQKIVNAVLCRGHAGCGNLYKNSSRRYVVQRYNYIVSKKPAISLDDYRALSEFRFCVRQFIRVSEANARRAGVHPQQHRLLLAIKGMPPGGSATIGSVAKRLQIEHHSAVELINRAQSRGLVSRRQDSQDHRVVVVGITERGERLLERLSVENRDELRSSAPALVRALRSLTRKRSGQRAAKAAANG
jgi:DNA-binding MarR family transcriptional regulator